jgi:hypothetical protein
MDLAASVLGWHLGPCPEACIACTFQAIPGPALLWRLAGAGGGVGVTDWRQAEASTGEAAVGLGAGVTV